MRACKGPPGADKCIQKAKKENMAAALGCFSPSFRRMPESIFPNYQGTDEPGFVPEAAKSTQRHMNTGTNDMSVT